LLFDLIPSPIPHLTLVFFLLNIRYADRKEKEARAKKKAAQEKLIKAAGPSPKKNIQRRLNRAALQRKAAKGDGNTACVGKKRQRGRNQN
jgi:hypothetical protein